MAARRVRMNQRREAQEEMRAEAIAGRMPRELGPEAEDDGVLRCCPIDSLLRSRYLRQRGCRQEGKQKAK